MGQVPSDVMVPFYGFCMFLVNEDRVTENVRHQLNGEDMEVDPTITKILDSWINCFFST